MLLCCLLPPRSPLPAARCRYPTIKFIFPQPFPFPVLWDNATRFVFTLAAAILGLVAYFLFPSRAQLEQKLTSSYEKKGKWLLFVFGFLTLGLAGVLGWEFFRYRVQNGWVGVNLAIYAVMGCAILAGNIRTMRAVRHSAEHVEIVEAEVVELSSGNGGQPGLLAEGAVLEPLPGPLPPPDVSGPEEPREPKE